MPRAQEAQERRVSILHKVILSAWAPRSRGTFLPDSPQAHPCGLGRDIHVAHGPEVRYLTPSALCVITVQWFLIDANPFQVKPARCSSIRNHSINVTHIAEGVWSLFQDRTRQEVEFAPPWMGSRHVLKQGPHHLGAHAD